VKIMGKLHSRTLPWCNENGDRVDDRTTEPCIYITWERLELSRLRFIIKSQSANVSCSTVRTFLWSFFLVIFCGIFFVLFVVYPLVATYLQPEKFELQPTCKRKKKNSCNQRATAQNSSHNPHATRIFLVAIHVQLEKSQSQSTCN
jgi:hypothetical protein